MLGGAFSLLAVLVLSSSCALAVVTAYLHRDARDLGKSVESVRLAQELELQLTTHNRASNYGLMNAETYGPPPPVAEARLRRRLEEATPYATDPEEKSLLARVRNSVEAYLASQRDAQARQLPLSARIVETRPALDQTLVAVDALIDHDVAESRTFLQRAHEADIVAQGLSFGIGFVAVIGIGLVILSLRRRVYGPLEELRATIARFGAGDAEARAREAGPSELRQIATVFNTMAENLANREQRQRVFLGGIAHDLRNPLAAIQMSVRRLVSANAAIPSDRVRSVVELVDRQIERLAQMTDDFLDFSRIQAGKLELRFESCDLKNLTSEATELYRALSRSHRFELRVPDRPVVVSCDPTRMGQVLHNLLSNAVKYSPDGGLVRVALEEDSSDVHIVVTDEGIGIDPADLGAIFEPFRRTKVSRELVPGVGLGLSVLRRIVESHGGHVRVESVPGEGSTFRVRIPRVDLEAEASARLNCAPSYARQS